MPETPIACAPHRIEPELLAATPRAVRKRRFPSDWHTQVFIGIALAYLSWFAAKSAWVLSAIWLTASYGQIVPARVSYQASVDTTSSFRGEVYQDALLAQFTYRWQGERWRDTRVVDASLIRRFRNHSIVPVRVLRPFPILEWPGSNEEPRALRRVRAAWQVSRWQFLIFGGNVGLLGLFFLWADKRERRLVSEGKPTVGYIVEYRTKDGRPITGKFPKYDSIQVVFEFPALAGWREEGMQRARRRCLAKRAALLPAVGQPVTVLLLPTRRRPMSCPYPICPYEAFSPGDEHAGTQPSAPRPGTG